MKYLIILHIFLFYSSGIRAQTPETWTWMGGSEKPLLPSQTSNHTVRYGEKGVADSLNSPGYFTPEASWVDTNGHFWLMDQGYTDVLWRYDGTNWAWMFGDTIYQLHFRYVDQGICDATNTPGRRYYSANASDNEGNLWLYGGFGHKNDYREPAFSDLWQWNGKCWTLLAGDSTPFKKTVYGQKGVPHANNHPGIRNNAVMWCDSKNNLWLFGGDSLGMQRNDLWKWDGQNWTWVHGPKWYGNVEPFPENGVKVDSSHPLPLSSAAGVCKNDTLYLFGGYRLYLSPFSKHRGYHNGLWQFDGYKWTLLSGSDSLQFQRDYQRPDGHVYERANACLWKDLRGDIWMFGGEKIIASDYDNQPRYNDLWRWDGSKWHKVKTINHDQYQVTQHSPFGYYGERSVADNHNIPGGRSYTGCWVDSTGNFWVYGGIGMGSHQSSYKDPSFLSDLWKFTPDYSVNRQEAKRVNGISLYPNPASRQLHIAMPKQMSVQHLKVVNSQGQVVYHLPTVARQNITLNTQNWPTGVYFLMGNTDDGLVREPFVVE